MIRFITLPLIWLNLSVFIILCYYINTASSSRPYMLKKNLNILKSRYIYLKQQVGKKSHISIQIRWLYALYLISLHWYEKMLVSPLNCLFFHSIGRNLYVWLLWNVWLFKGWRMFVVQTFYMNWQKIILEFIHFTFIHDTFLLLS